MIFSTFFKAKWQHKNAQTRLTAIAEFTVDDTEHKTILLSLAEQDNDENVRKSALLKLNNFDTWQQASKYNSKPAIQQFAQKQLEKHIIETNPQLTVEAKLSLLENINKPAFLETWLAVENSQEIIKALYQKIAKPSLALSLFSKQQDEAFQLFLLESIDDLSLLEKLAKKTTITTVENTINEQLAIAEAEKQKPILLAKKIQLCLSKLLALKDISDYGEVLKKRTTIEDEWLGYQSDITCLSNDEHTVFKSKYQQISNQLNKLFVEKAEAYQQQMIAEQLAVEQKQAKAHFDDTLQTLNQKISNAVFDNSVLDNSDFEKQLIQLHNNVLASVLNPHEQQHFVQAITTQQKTLEKIPEIAQSVADATQLIARISQLCLPKTLSELNDKFAVFQQWQKDWQHIEKMSIGLLPESIVSAKSEIVAQWKTGLAPFIKEQKDTFHQSKKKVADLQRLISQGKFNPCFGIYKKLTVQVQQLSEQQQERLSRELTVISEKLDELADWEHYIATPRKQALLDDMKLLVTQPLDNPNEQADKVKSCRKIWNSLGHADEDLDMALNNEFNVVCEQAFAPCRLFYAEQEKIRQQHAKKRQQLIDDVNLLAKQLDSNDIDWKKIDIELSKLMHAWRDAGDVERNEYKRLHSKYNEALSPIKQAVHQYQQNNIKAKELLIEKAQHSLTLDDIFTAVEQVKQYQQQWRDIGFAGIKAENTLWQKFRKVNDYVFTKRDQVKLEQNAEQQVLENALVVKFDQIASALNDVNTLPELTTLLTQAKTIHSDIIQHKPVNKKLANHGDKIIARVEHKLEKTQNNKVKLGYQHLFEVLEQLVTENADLSIDELESFTLLPSFWRKKVTDLINLKTTVDRTKQTLTLEILGGIESPKAYAAQRLATQVALMQEQMVSGVDVDLQNLLVDWLLLGKLTQQDTALLKRIKPLYI
jgi:hypothetical protein